jgi:hypothetical protein
MNDSQTRIRTRKKRQCNFEHINNMVWPCQSIKMLFCLVLSKYITSINAPDVE